MVGAISFVVFLLVSWSASIAATATADLDPEIVTLMDKFTSNKTTLDQFIFGFNFHHLDSAVVTDFVFRAAVGEFNLTFTTTVDEAAARQNLIQNLRSVVQLNSDPSGPVKFGISRYSFTTFDSFKKASLQYPVSMSDYQDICSNFTSSSEISSGVNLVDSGAVGPVKDQQSCGCGWAFAAVATIEAAVHSNTGVLHSFSEQYVLECNSEHFDCYFGLLDRVYDLVASTENLPLTDSRPYTAKNSYYCDPNIPKNEVIFAGYDVVCRDDVESRLSLLSDGIVFGMPLFLDESLFHYKKGILDEETACGGIGDRVNHAVAAVGYGTENGTDFWLLRNSFGDSMNDAGYFKVKRGINWCNCELYAYFPRV